MPEWNPVTGIAEWGSVQIIIGGNDCTFYRGVPCELTSMDWTEPFDDATIEIRFPQISTMEDIPNFLGDYNEILVYHVGPGGAQQEEMWRGVISEVGASNSPDEDVTIVQGVGTLYRGDFYLRAPIINYGKTIWPNAAGTTTDTVDLLGILRQELERPAWKLLPLASEGGGGGIVGVPVVARGSFEPLVTGYIGQLLSVAYNDIFLDQDGTEDARGIIPAGDGYLIVTNEGNVIPFNGAPYYGSFKGLRVDDSITDIQMTPSGEGYYLLAADGGVFTFGDAWFHGNTFGNPVDAEAMAVDPDDGYLILLADGGIYNFGTSSYHGSAFGSVPAGESATDVIVTASGNGYWILLTDGTILEFGDAGAVSAFVGTSSPFTAFAQDPDGGFWGMNLDGGVFTTGGASYHGSAFGLISGFGMDIMGTSTGDGYYVLDSTGGLFTFGDAVYYGNPNDGSGDVHQWTLMMREDAVPVFRLKDVVTTDWTVSWGAPGIHGDLNRDLSVAFNAFYAEGIDLNKCRWRNTKAFVSPDGKFDGSFIAPLAVDDDVEPFEYEGSGTLGDITGSNPDFDEDVVRVEHYENLGENITKLMGASIARNAMKRDGRPTYAGTVTIKSDPEEGSRFDIRPGQNIVLKHFRGANRKFHISRASMRFGEEFAVDLTLDQMGMDYLGVKAALEREHGTTSPQRRRTYRNTKISSVTDDRAVWDCEAGSGALADAFVTGSTWTIHRFKAGEVGNVVETDIQLDGIAPFFAGIFDRPVEVSDLTSHGSIDSEEDFWDDFDGPTTGLIIAWGDVNQMAGYSTGLQSEGDAVTGRLLDTAQWYYESYQPPFLWLAIKMPNAYSPTLFTMNLRHGFLD